jgi:site-specific DNA-cytosine methylase
VFVVGYLGDWRPAASVLFERESLCGHPAPSRETGQRTTRAFETGPHGGNLTDLASTLDTRCKDGGANWQAIAYPINTQIALRHNCLGEGTGLGVGEPDDPAFTIQANHSHAVACFKAGQGAKAGGIGYDEHVAPTLSSADSGTNRTPALMQGNAVRRLTPVECERLQGFSDNYTLIPVGKKTAADGPRYKALGNSMAVPVMRWIGERISRVENGMRMKPPFEAAPE